MTCSLSKSSLRELTGVHPSLVAVVHRAIEITEQDFAVHDGLRTDQEQAALVASGASKTRNSKHIIQNDGYGHAVDLVPVINGKLRWEWGPIYMIAAAVDTAATELGVALRWGGVWDKPLAAYGGSPEALRKETDAYCIRHPGQDFIDGPHFELA